MCLLFVLKQKQFHFFTTGMSHCAVFTPAAPILNFVSVGDEASLEVSVTASTDSGGLTPQTFLVFVSSASGQLDSLSVPFEGVSQTVIYSFFSFVLFVYFMLKLKWHVDTFRWIDCRENLLGYGSCFQRVGAWHQQFSEVNFVRYLFLEAVFIEETQIILLDPEHLFFRCFARNCVRHFSRESERELRYADMEATDTDGGVPN